ncbi:MazG nucleotide pyrophosphohydrolase domain-containing protein [Methylobacterium indicum]|uniref:NTP pyrophosphohydrolase MazG putative catalytic core domain-containing protein n=1 Tax=Methylobacterium indicum TaxID=1775910 RepID=A0A8H8X0Q5_9HYPH|nr:MazG nucleotide pyrophosphohydrolase domain-containing protein [Methylobacterium indicum]BCM87859.1 hypothetical protein mvi_63200 [Methylobacterium indicum]
MNANEYATFCEQRDEYPVVIERNASAAMDTLEIVAAAASLANQVKKIYRDDGGHITGKRGDSILNHAEDAISGLEALINFIKMSPEDQVKVPEQTMPTGAHIVFLTLGLIGEAGEIAEKIYYAQLTEGGEISEARRLMLAKELGGTAWYFVRLAAVLGYSVEDIFRINTEELRGRMARGTILGDGDDR